MPLHKQRAAALAMSSNALAPPSGKAAAAAAGGDGRQKFCPTGARHCFDSCLRRWPIYEPQALASQLAKVSACKYGCLFDVGVRPEDCTPSCERLVNFSQLSTQSVGHHDALGACVAGCRARRTRQL
ncbi:hypothetical protein Esti_003025 [Eimeria stiedai]